MHHIRGVAREQVALLPPALDDFVGEDHSVRVIDAFVESLDLKKLGFERVEVEPTGRPPYHPADLLKLYLYGYLNRIRSSRHLERECHRNVEVMWLIGQLKPDFKTIATFRAASREALRGVCRALVMFCRQQGLVGGEVVAIDGSKFEAAASPRKAFTTGQLERTIREVDARIEQYLAEMDRRDMAEQEETTTGRTVDALEALRRRREELQALAAEMVLNEQKQVVQGEAEARIMGQAPPVVGYNVQTAVDAKNKLIVHHDVVNDVNDRRQLHPMASETKKVLDVEALQVLADSGYHNAEHAGLCEAEGIEAAVPLQRNSNQYNEHFSKEAFVYDSESDTYRCPAGAVMTPRKSLTHDGRRLYRTAACRQCPLRPQCTNRKRREISRSPHEGAAVRADQRARSGTMTQRKALVEHPFAWLKRTVGRFATRGLDNVKTEVALAVTAYNLLRLINIVGSRQLLAQIPAR